MVVISFGKKGRKKTVNRNGIQGKETSSCISTGCYIIYQWKEIVAIFSFSFLNAVFAGMFSAESHCLLIQSIVNIVPKKIKYYWEQKQFSARHSNGGILFQ